jgi:hypothetical protein
LQSYNVGGHLYSFNDIEQGLIRGNKPAPYHLCPVFRRGDPRAAYVVTTSVGRCRLNQVDP